MSDQSTSDSKAAAPKSLGSIFSFPSKETVESFLPPKPSFMPPLPSFGADAKQNANNQRPSSASAAESENAVDDANGTTIPTAEETSTSSTEDVSEHSQPELEKKKFVIGQSFTKVMSKLSSEYLPPPPPLPSLHLPGTDKTTTVPKDKAGKNGDLIRSLRLQEQNMLIGLIVGGVASAELVSILIGVLAWTFHGQTGGSAYMQNARLLLYFVMVALLAHRLAALLFGLLVRRILQSQATNKGAFDIHIGWISYRGPVDRSQVVIHNVVWRNPPGFTQSPYLLRIRELRVAIDPATIILSLLRDPKRPVIKIEEVILDGAEIHSERLAQEPGQYEPGELNVFVAVGQNNHKAKTALQSAFKYVLEKIKAKLASGPFQSNKDDDEDAAECVTVDEPTSANTSKHTKHHNRHQKHDADPEPSIDLGRLIIFDLMIHVGDIFSNTHVTSKEGTAVKIRMLHVQRKDVTGDPVEPGGDRVPLPPSQFGPKMGDQIAGALIKDNKTTIPRLMASVFATNTKTALANLMRGTQASTPSSHLEE